MQSCRPPPELQEEREGEREGGSVVAALGLGEEEEEEGRAPMHMDRM